VSVIATYDESYLMVPFDDPYKVHQFLAKEFDGVDLGNSRFLHRFDRISEQMLVSVRTPPGLMPDSLSHQSKLVEIELEKGAEYAFRLRTPAYTRSHGVVNNKLGLEAIEWLKDRSKARGFEVISSVADNTAECFRIRGRKTYINDTEFEGHLRIVDPEILAGVLLQGFGRSKGLGYGLLELNVE